MRGGSTATGSSGFLTRSTPSNGNEDHSTKEGREEVSDTSRRVSDRRLEGVSRKARTSDAGRGSRVRRWPSSTGGDPRERVVSRETTLPVENFCGKLRGRSRSVGTLPPGIWRRAPPRGTGTSFPVVSGRPRQAGWVASRPLRIERGEEGRRIVSSGRLDKRRGWTSPGGLIARLILSGEQPPSRPPRHRGPQAAREAAGPSAWWPARRRGCRHVGVVAGTSAWWP